MPIKDLQHKDKPGLSRAGVIRLGYKMRKCNKCGNVRVAETCPTCGKNNFKTYTRNGEKYPVEFPTQSDHFVLTDAPDVAEALGTNEPKELNIWFPFNEIDMVFPAYHQLWVAGGLICRGDGEKIEYAINPQSGKTIIRDGRAVDDFSAKDGDFKRGDFMPCPGMAHNTYTRCQNCKPNAMLIVMLRDVPRLAYYQIATSSIHNIVNLTEQLTFILQNVGRLQGVPFVLKLQKRAISAPAGDNGKRQRVEKYLLSLEVDPEYYQRIVATQNKLAAPERQLQLDSGDVVDSEAEVIEPLQPAPEVGTIEPPEWAAPNGNDDSEFITADWDLFKADILEKIPFYRDDDHIADVMNDLNIAYDPENEDFIFDQLARHASNQADQQSAEETAEMILNGNKQQVELPT